ncbi:RAN GTPase-activating protein 2-like [Impatiens glandulifera]|uniref:RAN GTPase-activating protein 2-like n=1 Tax=Impatiens glandulifera TaxID=253017 RepID=UPI001FB0A9F9|nr:RAN GTPase-activating protein 2-like [Impatiens glandulifera]
MEISAPTPHPHSISIKIWPPSQNTRLTLVERIVDNLLNQSISTLKYGFLTKEEAAKNGKEIEESAFKIGNELFEKESDGDGNSAVQLYAKECSKNILEILKRGSRPKEVKETCFDISNGKRAFIEEEEARELLKPLKEPGNCFTKICFSNRSFGLGAANVAKPILESIKNQLEEVDLSDFVAGRPEEEALQVMNIFSAALEGSVLRLLDLSNNALGEKGVRAFEKLLKSQSKLEKLYLMNDGISEEAAGAVCELIPSTANLKVLHFHNNMTGDEGALAIAEIVKQSPLLEDFRCSSTRVESDGGIALCEALETCSQLKRLDLRDNMFGVEAGKSLSKTILKRGNLIEEIYLSYLNLEDEGVIAIVDALKESSPLLEVLDIAGNDITAGAAPSIVACIKEKEYLVKLILSENDLKDEGAIEISSALEASHGPLKEVDLSVNSIRRAGARMIAQAVVGKPEMKLLNLDGNFISDEGVDELKSIFKSSPGVLGSLDENDPEGSDDHDSETEEKESGDDDEDDLEAEMKKLGINSSS